MKKIFGLLALILLLGCDDGEMTFKTFDFSAVQPQACSDSNLIYKANGTEVLILDISPASFINVVTPPNQPRNITVGTGANKIIYRNYSGQVSTGATGTLCSIIPPATPTVVEEWNGEGNVSIITTEIRNEAGALTGYNHQITLVNIKFSNDDQQIIINDNLFGTYTTPLTYSFNFGEEDAIAIENCNGLIYKKNLSEALFVSLPQGLPNTTGTTETDLSLANDNKDVYFNVYSSSVTNATICSSIPPVTPVINERWVAISGSLKIVTTQVGPTLNHKIYFSNVTFSNGSNNGETFVIGQPLNGQSNDYLFGTYIPG